jgi:hypothetical protein
MTVHFLVEHPVLGRGYIEAKTDTTQQSGQTPDKEVEIKKTLQFMSAATLKCQTVGADNIPVLSVSV